MLHRVLAEITGRGFTPSLSCIVIKNHRTVFSRTFPENSPKVPVYDTASLTKPLLTFPLVQSMLKDLDQPLKHFLPETRLQATIRQLSSHTGGLKPWLPLYLYDRPYLDTIEVNGAGTAGHVYSCLGYIALCRALSRAADAPFEQLARHYLAETDGCEFSPGPRPDVQPTENGNRHERKLAEGFFPDPDPTKFRPDTLIHGQVHDLNAFHDGGLSGNAGLFATAEGCGQLTERLLKEPDWPLPLMEGRVYRYHMGFTGTGIAVSPDRKIIIVFLSNRVHPEVRPVDFSEIRHRVFQAAFTEFA